MKKYEISLVYIVAITLLAGTIHYAFAEIDPIQINVSIPLEGLPSFAVSSTHVLFQSK